MTTAATRTTTRSDASDEIKALADKFIALLETNELPAGLFHDDAFCDLTVPEWRLQAIGPDNILGLRLAGHPVGGRVPRARIDTTPTGFVLEVEETWEQGGDSWYCRELFRADVVDGRISELSIYCTGDWSSNQVARHKATVQLIRP